MSVARIYEAPISGLRVVDAEKPRVREAGKARPHLQVVPDLPREVSRPVPVPRRHFEGEGAKALYPDVGRAKVNRGAVEPLMTAGMRKFVGAAALLVAGIGTAVLGTAVMGADTPSVTVQSGDTLWSIASSISGAPNTQAAVKDIVSINSLGSENVIPGQTLRLPSY